jgi:hypothetical protein
LVLPIAAALALAACGRFGLGLSQDGIVDDGGNDADDGSTGDGDADADADADAGDAEGDGDGAHTTGNLVEGVEGGGELPRIEGFTTVSAVLPEGVSFPGAVGVGEGVYVAGGSFGLGPTTCSNRLYEVSPIGGGVADVATLTIMNQGLQLLASRDGLIYLVMGYCGSAPEEEARTYSFDPSTEALTVAGSFVEGSYHFGGGLLPGPAGTDVIVAAAGFGSGPLYRWVQYLDPLSGAADMLVAEFESDRCMMASAVSGGVLYVFGGYTETNCNASALTSSSLLLSDVVAVQVVPDRVEVVGAMPEPIAGSCAVTRPDGSIVLFGGHRFNETTLRLEPVATVHTFDPTSLEVKVHGAVLPAPRSALGCAITDDGAIYVLGGIDQGLAATGEVLLFEPFKSEHVVIGDPVDAGGAGAQWTAATVVADVPEGAAVALSIRVGDALDRLPDDPVGWTSVGLDGTLPDTLPRGRYLEWRTDLTTSNPAVTPRLEELRFSYLVP